MACPGAYVQSRGVIRDLPARSSPPRRLDDEQTLFSSIPDDHEYVRRLTWGRKGQENADRSSGGEFLLVVPFLQSGQSPRTRGLRCTVYRRGSDPRLRGLSRIHRPCGTGLGAVLCCVDYIPSCRRASSACVLKTSQLVRSALRPDNSCRPASELAAGPRAYSFTGSLRARHTSIQLLPLPSNSSARGGCHTHILGHSSTGGLQPHLWRMMRAGVSDISGGPRRR